MKGKLPSLITVLILTLITVLMWIGFNVYRAVTAKSNPIVAKEITQDLNPNLKKDIIGRIKTGIFLTENEIPEIKIEVSPTPTSTSTISPVPTSSPTLTATPIQSGQPL